jgi:hypothetical protein
MKTLVIADIHNKWELADKIVNTIPHDKLILTGDVFDSFGDSVLKARQSAIWLKKILQKDTTEIIFSNHDIAYWKPDFTMLWCPGFTTEKCRAINEHISPELWEKKFNLVWFEQGFTLSHAGFHSDALPYYPDLLAKNSESNITEEYIARACDDAFDAILKRRRHPVLENGSRMGNAYKGGCFWLDWSEFEPLKGINQIVGHTPANEVRRKHLRDDKGNITSRNYCLDTQLRCVGMIENDEFSWMDLKEGKVWKD